MGGSELFIITLIGGAIYLAVKRPKVRKGADGAFICSDCGTRGTPWTRTHGSLGIEIILWLCFIIPGVIYSIWRLTTRHKVCPSCGHDTMIPSDTPRGQQLIREFQTPT